MWIDSQYMLAVGPTVCCLSRASPGPDPGSHFYTSHYSPLLSPNHTTEHWYISIPLSLTHVILRDFSHPKSMCARYIQSHIIYMQVPKTSWSFFTSYSFVCENSGGGFFWVGGGYPGYLWENLKGDTGLHGFFIRTAYNYLLPTPPLTPILEGRGWRREWRTTIGKRRSNITPRQLHERSWANTNNVGMTLSFPYWKSLSGQRSYFPEHAHRGCIRFCLKFVC